MTKTMHTPGPWKAEWGTRNITYQDWQVYDENETELCIDIPNGPEAEANAHLIAASPELLETCKEMVKHLEETDFDVSGTPDAWMDKWKAIITKATGGQP